MSWNFLISFAVGFGVYMLFLGVFALIKRHRIKKQVEHEDEAIDNEEQKDN